MEAHRSSLVSSIGRSILTAALLTRIQATLRKRRRDSSTGAFSCSEIGRCSNEPIAAAKPGNRLATISGVRSLTNTVAPAL